MVALDVVPVRPRHDAEIRRLRQHRPSLERPGLHQGAHQHADLFRRAGADHDLAGANPGVIAQQSEGSSAAASSTAIFLPCVTSLVAYSVLFKGMFALDGIVNSTLEAIGIIASPIPWLTHPFWAKVLVIIAITWRWTGYNMIFYLAAMQNIDKSIYE